MWKALELLGCDLVTLVRLPKTQEQEERFNVLMLSDNAQMAVSGWEVGGWEVT